MAFELNTELYISALECIADPEKRLAEAKKDSRRLDWVLLHCQTTVWREEFGGAVREIHSRADIDAVMESKP